VLAGELDQAADFGVAGRQVLGEVGVGQLVEALARGEADQGQASAGYVPGPVRAPAEPVRDVGDACDVALVERRPNLR
jgi:hypothetical protein